MRRIPEMIELVHHLCLLDPFGCDLIDYENPAVGCNDAPHLSEYGDRLEDVMQGLGARDQIDRSRAEREGRTVRDHRFHVRVTEGGLFEHPKRQIDRELAPCDVVEQRQEVPRPSPDLRDDGPLPDAGEIDNTHLIESARSARRESLGGAFELPLNQSPVPGSFVYRNQAGALSNSSTFWWRGAPILVRSLWGS